MNVIRADILGYCEGVRHAVAAAEQALSSSAGRPVYTLGPLVHNAAALAPLEQRGLHILRESEIAYAEQGSVVVVRAHGVPPEVEQQLHEHGCAVVNATCTRVTGSQRIAAQYAVQGYTVLFAGDRNHEEVNGIAGYAGERFRLVQNHEEAASLTLAADEKAVLLSQTTFSPVEFEAMAAIITRTYPNVRVINTICPATKARQDALRRLCAQTDGVIVIGGRNSANTQRLFTEAQKESACAALVETESEIPGIFFTLKVVGITAGASTPDAVIDAVEQRLLNERKTQ